MKGAHMLKFEKILLLCGAIFALGYLFAKQSFPFGKKKAFLSKQDNLDIARMVHEGGNPAPVKTSVQR